MGVHIIHNEDDSEAVMYCSVSMWAFGPVFSETDGVYASDMIEAFLLWLKPADPRGTDAWLLDKYYKFLNLTPQEKHEAGLCETLQIEFDCPECIRENDEV